MTARNRSIHFKSGALKRGVKDAYGGLKTGGVGSHFNMLRHLGNDRLWINPEWKLDSTSVMVWGVVGKHI